MKRVNTNVVRGTLNMKSLTLGSQRMLSRPMLLSAAMLASLIVSPTVLAQVELVGHWRFQDGVENSANAASQTETDVTIASDPELPHGMKSCAEFNGVSSKITVDKLNLLDENHSFSVASWVKLDDGGDDVPGDIVSQFDATTRTGFQFGIYTHGGVTNSQSNTRQLHFGMDAETTVTEFTDHGQLGNAVYVFALCVHNEKLYAATCHTGANERGRVFRYEDGNRWTDLGSPDAANAISAMTVYDGHLFVASSKYRLAGSSLSESENPAFGGKVFRLGADDTWISCGQLSPETEAVSSLIEFKGQLYAGSLYKPAGFFRYDGGTQWTPLETPEGKRVEALTVFNCALFATSYDEGAVFKFDGLAWSRVGTIPDATQTYGFAVYDGSLFVSEWPKAHVFRYRGGTNWIDAGRLGEELETMPLIVYNGKMYGGTLPMAEVHRYEGGKSWTRIAQVDHTPDVRYRRAWSMAVYKGRLFVGTLPSGRVLSMEAGCNATWDRVFPSGWHHVAAVRDQQSLRVYVDGRVVSESNVSPTASLKFSTTTPLQIGFGAQDFFKGRLADLRVYRGALTADDVTKLVSP